jgi:hypothetical protein
MINWDEEMIQRYIDNQIEENFNLDYKAAGSISKSSGKKREMSKDVTAINYIWGPII